MTRKRSARLAAALACGLSVLAAPPAFAQRSGGETRTRQPQLTKAPRLVKFVEAEYPPSEAASGRAASVILQIAIADTGAVQDVVVAGSAGAAFDAAAVAAAKQFVFEPAEIDGKPGPVKITYEYKFVLEVKPAGPVVNFEGVVRDRLTKKPMAGVKVVVEGGGEAITDDDGRFRLEDVPEGPHAVTLSGDGLTTVSTEETIEKGKRLEARYTVDAKEETPPGEDADDLVVVVVVPKIVKEVVSTQIDAEQGRRVPGTAGDTLKVVQNLPGVARSSFGSGALVVWGAAPEDTRVYVDGVRIPLLYHGGGLRSTVHGDLVRSIELAPGGWGAEYGRGLGGLVTVATRAPRAERMHGSVAVDAIDGSAMIETPLGPSTRLAIAGRKSWLDRTLQLFTKKDVGDFIPIPAYWDGQAKVVHDLGPNETIELLALGSRDDLTRTVTDRDPAQIRSESTLNGFSRVALTWRRQLDDGASAWITPSIGHDRQRTTQRFGSTPSELDVAGESYGLRAGWRGKVGAHATVMAGVDFEAQRAELSRQGPVTLPAREGDVTVFGQPSGDQVNFDAWSTTLASVAPYGQVDLALFGDRVHVTPGVRVEPYLTGGSRRTPVKGETPAIGYTRQEIAIDPRLAARWQVSDRVGVKAAWGVYHQSPDAADLSAVFGNPELGISRATQLLGGVNVRLGETLSIEAVGFWSRSHDLASRSQASPPPLARALVQEKEGRAYGGQLLVRQELARGFFGWASYSLIRAERKDHPDGQWRLFDYDQTHVATAVGSYDLGKGFEVGARVRYATGFPRTPVVGAFYGARRDLFEPYFGEQNAIRVPSFFQADVRIAKKFVLGGEGGERQLEVFLDVQNVTNRRNSEDVVYNFDYSRRGYITGLPVLPVLGARLTW